LFGNGVVTTNTYDPARRWLDTTSIGSGSIYEATYARDALGRIIDLSEHAPTNTDNLHFTYDELGRIRRVDATDPKLERQMVHDAIGRITYNSKLGDYHYTDVDHPHAMTSADFGSQRRNDDNGNTIAMTDPSGRLLRISWTVDDRPAQIHANSGV
jgi:YD repeat-containing protein